MQTIRFEISPAFKSTREALVFSGLVLSFLVMPLLLSWITRLDRADVYPVIPLRYGAYTWIQQQIFDESSSVDIAFIGSSRIFNGIDAPYVQKELSRLLGREAKVITLGWYFGGYDADYFIVRDLQRHRRVRMLVFCDALQIGSGPHANASRWFRIGEDADDTDGVSWLWFVRLYSSAVLGAPRHALSLVRPNLMDDPASCEPSFLNVAYHSPNFAQNLGTQRSHLEFPLNQKFVPVEIIGSKMAASVNRHSGLPGLSLSKLPAYQRHFTRKTGDLCRERGTKVVVVHLPVYKEGRSILEYVYWPDYGDGKVDILEIPYATLFADFSSEGVGSFFYDSLHLNEKGQRLFTPAITPHLLEIYQSLSDGP